MPVRTVSIKQLQSMLANVDGMPPAAVDPLSAVIYLHLPLPRDIQSLWNRAAAELRVLRQALDRFTDDSTAACYIDGFFQLYARERESIDDLVVVHEDPDGQGGGIGFAPDARIEQFGADRRNPDRTRLLIGGFAVLQHAGLTQANACAVMADVLALFTEDHAAISPDSLKREYMIARNRYKETIPLRILDKTALEKVLASPAGRRIPITDPCGEDVPTKARPDYDRADPPRLCDPDGRPIDDAGDNPEDFKPLPDKLQKLIDRWITTGEPPSPDDLPFRRSPDDKKPDSQ